MINKDRFFKLAGLADRQHEKERQAGELIRELPSRILYDGTKVYTFSDANLVARCEAQQEEARKMRRYYAVTLEKEGAPINTNVLTPDGQRFVRVSRYPGDTYPKVDIEDMPLGEGVV